MVKDEGLRKPRIVAMGATTPRTQPGTHPVSCQMVEWSWREGWVTLVRHRPDLLGSVILLVVGWAPSLLPCWAPKC